MVSYRHIRVSITQAYNIADLLLKYHPPEVSYGVIKRVLRHDVSLRANIPED